jgi:hypothetical protein
MQQETRLKKRKPYLRIDRAHQILSLKTSNIQCWPSCTKAKIMQLQGHAWWATGSFLNCPRPDSVGNHAIQNFVISDLHPKALQDLYPTRHRLQNTEHVPTIAIQLINMNISLKAVKIKLCFQMTSLSCFLVVSLNYSYSTIFQATINRSLNIMIVLYVQSQNRMVEYERRSRRIHFMGNGRNAWIPDAQPSQVSYSVESYLSNRKSRSTISDIS